jgi:hypothetical protein
MTQEVRQHAQLTCEGEREGRREVLAEHARDKEWSYCGEGKAARMQRRPACVVYVARILEIDFVAECAETEKTKYRLWLQSMWRVEDISVAQTVHCVHKPPAHHDGKEPQVLILHPCLRVDAFIFIGTPRKHTHP